MEILDFDEHLTIEKIDQKKTLESYQRRFNMVTKKYDDKEQRIVNRRVIKLSIMVKNLIFYWFPNPAYFSNERIIIQTFYELITQYFQKNIKQYDLLVFTQDELQEINERAKFRQLEQQEE